MTTTAPTSALAFQSPAPALWRAPDGSYVDVAAAVLAYQAGDDQALHTLMLCFDRLMKSVARRYLRCSQDVEDAVQDAWVSFVRAAESIDTPSAIAGWLSTTTARAALAIARRLSRCVPSDVALELPVRTDEIERLGREEEAAIVREAIARLRTADRELISMLFDRELTYNEIEARTGRASGAIGPTRQRVLARLRSDRSIRRVALTRA